jgi:hypothetical protein
MWYLYERFLISEKGESNELERYLDAFEDFRI